MTQRRTIHHMLTDARARYRRVGPHEALSAMDDGALLIDVRDGDQRRRDGVIPGALAIDLTILLWRVDPDSGASHPGIPSLETPLILLCNQGYSSSLAVAALLDLGATKVTDVVGGFEAWSAAGLPVWRRQSDSRTDLKSRRRFAGGVADHRHEERAEPVERLPRWSPRRRA